MTISIVIPSLNEGEYIHKTLKHLISLPGDFEIIVVDGGSKDQTVAKVNEFDGVKLISSERGRGIQMNHGAQIAKGEILLFLHADTFLPHNAYPSILTFMQDKSNIGGSFYLKLNKDHILLNFYTWCSKLSLEFFTYGDHGIFIRKSVFEQIGGYKKIPFLEDVEIQKRLRKVGRFKKLGSAVTSSARRFEKGGTIKQFFLALILILLFKLGVSPVRLKIFYKDHC